MNRRNTLIWTAAFIMLAASFSVALSLVWKKFKDVSLKHEEVSLRYERSQRLMHCKIYDLSDIKAEEINTWYTIDDEFEAFGATCYKADQKPYLELYFVSNFKDWQIKWFIVHSENKVPSYSTISINAPFEYYNVKSWFPVGDGLAKDGSTFYASKGHVIAKSEDGKIKIWAMAASKNQIRK